MAKTPFISECIAFMHLRGDHDRASMLIEEVVSLQAEARTEAYEEALRIFKTRRPKKEQLFELECLVKAGKGEL